MEQLPSALPVLPIRNTVVFSSISVPLVVGREKSLKALERAEAGSGLIIIVAQKVLTAGDPQAGDLHAVGTPSKIESASPTEAGSRQIVVTGVSRYRIEE